MDEFGSTVGEYMKKQGHKQPPICCTSETTITEVLDLLVNNKIHRIFLVDDEMKPMKVVSLCDVISILENICR